MTKIKYTGTHNGFCRCYYKISYRIGRTVHLCLQLSGNGRDDGSIDGSIDEQYYCSKDGEPSHLSGFDLSDFPLPTGTTATDIEVRAFLSIYRAEN